MMIISTNQPNFLLKYRHQLVLFLLFAQAILSLWQSNYSIDPFHWGLMLSNAKDLANGKVPYLEIWIQYGFLTTAIQAISYVLFQESMRGIIVITILCNSIGLVFLYLMARHFFNKSIMPLIILIAVIAFHPIVIYPWSNYIAFPFLTSGLYLYIFNKKYLYHFFSGILFGMAILAREGLFLSIIVFVIASGILSLLKTKSFWYSTRSLMFIFIGISTPIFTFFLYVRANDLFDYWLILSYELPKIYLNVYWPHLKGLHAFDLLIKTVWTGTVALNIRWIFVSALVVSCCFQVLNSIRLTIVNSNEDNDKNVEMTSVALLCLALLSSTLHSPEFFRFATGSIIGAIVLLKQIESKILPRATIFVFLVFSGIAIFSKDTGNLFFPTASQITTASNVQGLPYFRHQLWTPSVNRYYQTVDSILTQVKFEKCNVTHHYNNTKDAFLSVMSPFINIGVAPFYISPEESLLRKDSYPHTIKDNGPNVMILKMAQSETLANSEIPDGFRVYSVTPVPTMIFIPEQANLFVLLAKSCGG